MHTFVHQVEQYNEGFQHEEASPEHHSATSSEHGMSAFGDTASISVGEVGDVSIDMYCRK